MSNLEPIDDGKASGGASTELITFWIDEAHSIPTTDDAGADEFEESKKTPIDWDDRDPEESDDARADRMQDDYDNRQYNPSRLG